MKISKGEKKFNGNNETKQKMNAITTQLYRNNNDDTNGAG